MLKLTTINMLYNAKRKHTKNGMLSPVEFERQHETITEDVYKSWGYSMRRALIVLTGTHQNGSRITIAGSGAVGFDDAGSLGIEFEKPPEMVVEPDWSRDA
jgi:hypothetical protein